MATLNSNLTAGFGKSIYYNPMRLESLCSHVINKSPDLEHGLWHFGPYGRYGHEFAFERLSKYTRHVVNQRYLKSQKSFEKWFRGKVIFALDGVDSKIKIGNTVKDLESKILSLDIIIWKIQDFKKIFGVVKEVYGLLIAIRTHLEKLL